MKTFASKVNHGLAVLFLSGLALMVFPVYAEAADEAWYRRITIDAHERLSGVYPIDAEEANLSNAYLLKYDAAGRLVEVSYHRSGRSLADPLYGVNHIEISYGKDSILRVFSNSDGTPTPDEQGAPWICLPVWRIAIRSRI